MSGSSIPGLNLEHQGTDINNVENGSAGLANSPPTNAANDLQKLLAELAQYTSKSNQQDEQRQGLSQATHFTEEFLPSHQLQQIQTEQRHEARWVQSAPVAQSTTVHRMIDTRINTQLQQATALSAQSSRTPPIDPATILEWPQALRCINKISAQNPHLATVVKGVIVDNDAYCTNADH
jgi:hypothetical protein